MNIVSTIIPVFIIILLGLAARHRGFFSPDFISQANRLVYYIAIPAMIFSAISKAALKTEVNLPVILITLFSILAATGISWQAARFATLSRSGKGSFIQCSFHGNLGYIGLAVAFYYLGNNGFVKAAIIAGFVMILQNIVAVTVLQLHGGSDADGHRILNTIKNTMANPVILSALAGIGFSFMGLGMPLIIERALDILKGMALPMALLIIGASLSFEKFKPRASGILLSACLKLLVTPLIGFVCFKVFSIPSQDYLPALIILAAPTATLAYIMAREMNGDPDFAVAAISVCTLLSGITYGVWLSIG